MCIAFRPGAALVLAALVSSCSLQAKITLVADGPSEVQAALTLQPQAREAWASLRDLDPSLPADPLAPELWTSGLGSAARVTATADGMNVVIPVADPKKFFPGLRSDAAGWDLTLDRVALRKIANLSAWAGSPALDSLVPAPDSSVTEADYRDLLVYLLGPGLSDAAAKALVAGSSVEVTLVAPRPIATAPGAVSVSGRTAVYRWSLARALTLTPPVRIHLTF